MKKENNINYSILHYAAKALTGNELKVFLKIYLFYNLEVNRKKGAKLSASYIANACDLSLRSVKKIFASLHDKGFVRNTAKGEKTGRGYENETSTWIVNEDFILSLASGADFASDSGADFAPDSGANFAPKKQIYKNNNIKNNYIKVEMKSNKNVVEKNNNVIQASPAKQAEPETNSRKAAQEKLMAEFDTFIRRLNKLSLSEREKEFKTFIEKVGKTYTGKYISIVSEKLQKRYNGYISAMQRKNEPSLATAGEQPSGSDSVTNGCSRREQWLQFVNERHAAHVDTKEVLKKIKEAKDSSISGMTSLDWKEVLSLFGKLYTPKREEEKEQISQLTESDKAIFQKRITA